MEVCYCGSLRRSAAEIYLKVPKVKIKDKSKNWFGQVHDELIPKDRNLVVVLQAHNIY